MYVAGHHLGPHRLQHRTNRNEGRGRLEAPAEGLKIPEEKPQNASHLSIICHCDNNDYRFNSHQLIVHIVIVGSLYHYLDRFYFMLRSVSVVHYGASRLNDFKHP